MIIWWRGWGLLAVVPAALSCCGTMALGSLVPGASVQTESLVNGIAGGALLVVSGVVLLALDRRLKDRPERRFSDHSLFGVALGAWAYVYWVAALASIVIGVATGPWT